MEKNTKTLIGILVVLVIASVILKGQITGQATACSSVPEINKIYTTGDQLVVHWSDSSKFLGQSKYEIKVFRVVDGVEDLIRTDFTEVSRYGIRDLALGNYFVRIKAKNNNCGPDYTEYITSATVATTAA